MILNFCGLFNVGPFLNGLFFLFHSFLVIQFLHVTVNKSTVNLETPTPSRACIAYPTSSLHLGAGALPLTFLSPPDVDKPSPCKLMRLGVPNQIVNDSDFKLANFDQSSIRTSTTRSYRWSLFWSDFDLNLIIINQFWSLFNHVGLKDEKWPS